MRIRTVQTVCTELGKVERFYGEVLGLGTSRAGETLRVTAGTTTLEFTEDARTRPGSQHYAFTITTDAFAAAKEWLEERTGLLRQDDRDEFDFPAWNARSLYFDGPDGSILEFIIRRDLPSEYRGGFSPRDILCVSEVGVPVPDIDSFQARLHDYGIEPYLVGGPAFRPLGDALGLLIVVAPERPWFPTDRVAREQPLVVTIEAERAGELVANPAATVRLVAG